MLKKLNCFLWIYAAVPYKKKVLSKRNNIFTALRSPHKGGCQVWVYVVSASGEPTNRRSGHDILPLGLAGSGPVLIELSGQEEVQTVTAITMSHVSTFQWENQRTQEDQKGWNISLSWEAGMAKEGFLGTTHLRRDLEAQQELDRGRGKSWR